MPLAEEMLRSLTPLMRAVAPIVSASRGEMVADAAAAGGKDGLCESGGQRNEGVVDAAVAMMQLEGQKRDQSKIMRRELTPKNLTCGKPQICKLNILSLI